MHFTGGGGLLCRRNRSARTVSPVRNSECNIVVHQEERELQLTRRVLQNIGATILAVEVLNNDSFLSAPHVQADPRILRGAIYAVALASNTGALVTLPSSLAGLLWSRILQQKGVASIAVFCRRGQLAEQDLHPQASI